MKDAYSSHDDKSKKIDGYDEWEISSAVDTLIKAKEIQKDEKLLKLVRIELKKRKDAVDDALTEEQVEDKVGKKLKETFGG